MDKIESIKTYGYHIGTVCSTRKRVKTCLHDGGRVGDGFANEKLDCAVRAYAIAKEIPYKEAHDIFEKVGRKINHRTTWDIYSKLGFSFNDCYITLKQFIIDHPKGSFYVCKRGHAFAIKEGIVFDNNVLSERIIVRRWFEVK